jgi:hypothetical protein
MARTGTLYSILGLGPDATVEQIRSAFRKLALVHHPDRNRDSPESAARFVVIRNAYEVLSDPAHRREYDEFLRRSTAFGRERPTPGEDGDGRRLAGTAEDVRTILDHLHYVLWDIEDLIRSGPDWAVQFDGRSVRWYVESMLRAVDRWVLTPAGFPDYFYQARNIQPPVGLGGLAPRLGQNTGGHSPFIRVDSYFYHVRLRADQLMASARLSDLLRPIPGAGLRTVDAVLEAHNYCVHTLGHLKRRLGGDAGAIPPYRHRFPWFASQGV